MNIPIIELYEYQIHKYEPTDRMKSQDTKNQVFKFSDIDDSPLDNCKRITVDGYQQNLEEDTTRSTCDPIFNVGGKIGGKIGGKLEVKSYYDIDNLYGNYKLFLAKDVNTEKLDDDSIKKVMKNLSDILEAQYDLLEHFMNPTLKPLFDMINKSTFDESDILDICEFANNTAIIQQLKINDDTKIILFGDFHGSFHTFFRLLCRLHRYGILNLDSFKINDPYKIIFLGDILDRGMYALDILNVIFKLMVVNNSDPENQKIIFNRGNHENYDQYLLNFLDDIFHTPTAGNEISKKIHVKSLFSEFIVKLNLLFCALPSAVIINNQNKYKYWCCHGGFPNIIIPDNIFTFINDATYAQDIRWSDFGLQDATNTILYGPSSRGGNIKEYSIQGTINFLTHNNINYIIRGHQDSYGNSVLFVNGKLPIIISNPIYNTIKDMLYYNTNPKTYTNRSIGPIARLIPELIYGDLFPVLTISTNTDNGRNLNADSFALLRFDIKEDNIEDFTKNTLSIIQNIKETLKNKNINRNILMKKNLETCLKIYLEYDNEINYIINLMNIHKDIYKQELDKFPKSILDISLEIISIINDVYDIYVYYKEKYDALNTKINLYNDNHNISKEQYDIISKEISEYKKILDNISDKISKGKYFHAEKEYIEKEIDNIIINNKQKEILDNINTYILEFEQ